MPGLHHLDDMPITPKERRLAMAFLQGGLEVSGVDIPLCFGEGGAGGGACTDISGGQSVL